MANIVGVRFRKAGKVYYFDPAGFELKLNDPVVVETSRGQELGHVSIAPTQIEDSALEEPLKPVLRKAEESDVTRAREFEAKEKDVLVECGKLVKKLGLSMKLLSAEYSFDGSHITVYFSAEARVDFRKLVRELNSLFKTRVELRQVGSRDEAKLIGDFGRCGRPLCCATFMGEFSPVSIRMAKEQNLPLNPMRISGVCGRLLCCLGHESEFYRNMKEKMPREGQRVTTPVGAAVVVGANALKETVLVELETGAQVEFPLKEISYESKPAEERKVPEKPGKKEEDSLSEGEIALKDDISPGA